VIDNTRGFEVGLFKIPFVLLKTAFNVPYEFKESYVSGINVVTFDDPIFALFWL